jgi:hypothetical protein
MIVGIRFASPTAEAVGHPIQILYVCRRIRIRRRGASPHPTLRPAIRAPDKSAARASASGRGALPYGRGSAWRTVVLGALTSQQIPVVKRAEPRQSGDDSGRSPCWSKNPRKAAPPRAARRPRRSLRVCAAATCWSYPRLRRLWHRNRLPFASRFEPDGPIITIMRMAPGRAGVRAASVASEQPACGQKPAFSKGRRCAQSRRVRAFARLAWPCSFGL